MKLVKPWDLGSSDRAIRPPGVYQIALLLKEGPDAEERSEVNAGIIFLLDLKHKAGVGPVPSVPIQPPLCGLRTIT